MIHRATTNKRTHIYKASTFQNVTIIKYILKRYKIKNKGIL